MKMSKTAEYRIDGNKISVDELAEIVSEARHMMAKTITISQSTYSDPPYPSSTITTIEVEAER